MSLYLDNKLSEKRKSLDISVDSIRRKYGTYSIYRSNYLYSGIAPINGGVGDSDYPLMTSIL
jgi:DNA polymerase-4